MVIATLGKETHEKKRSVRHGLFITILATLNLTKDEMIPRRLSSYGNGIPSRSAIAQRAKQ